MTAISLAVVLVVIFNVSGLFFNWWMNRRFEAERKAFAAEEERRDKAGEWD